MGAQICPRETERPPGPMGSWNETGKIMRLLPGSEAGRAPREAARGKSHGGVMSIGVGQKMWRGGDGGGGALRAPRCCAKEADAVPWARAPEPWPGARLDVQVQKITSSGVGNRWETQGKRQGGPS